MAMSQNEITTMQPTQQPTTKRRNRQS
jgi:hypothetical protein